jgi:hypothetical protein
MLTFLLSILLYRLFKILKVIKYNNDIDKFYTFNVANFNFRVYLFAIHNCIL